jgi:hypothetical protein
VGRQRLVAKRDAASGQRLMAQVPAFASASTQTGGNMMYGSAATPQPPHLGLRSCPLLPQKGPYHTLSRPRKSEPLLMHYPQRQVSAGYLGTEYGTSAHRSNSRRSGSAAQVQRRVDVVFPSTRRSFDLCNTGTLSLDLQHTWTRVPPTAQAEARALV